jgi:hypothetical protein
LGIRIDIACYLVTLNQCAHHSAGALAIDFDRGWSNIEPLAVSKSHDLDC